jgi:hypothetical protein
MTRKSLNVPPASRQAGGRAQETEFDGAVDLRGVSTEKIDFDAGMLSTRHVAALRSNAAPPRERLRESPFFQRRVRREREFLRPIAPIVTGVGESPSTFKFDIAHHVPGRMRIRSAALKGNVCASEDARRPREPVYIAEGEFARGSTGGRKNLAGYRWFESISLHQ